MEFTKAFLGFFQSSARSVGLNLHGLPCCLGIKFYLGARHRRGLGKPVGFGEFIFTAIVAKDDAGIHVVAITEDDPLKGLVLTHRVLSYISKTSPDGFRAEAPANETR